MRRLPQGLLLFSLSAGAWAEAPAGAPRPISSPVSGGQFLETLAGLAVVLLLIFALTFLVRRFGNLPGMGKGPIKVLGGTSLGSREKAVLIEVEGQRLLLGVAPGRVQMLHVLPAKAGDEHFETALSNATGAQAE